MEDQSGKRDIFALLPHTYTSKLTLCFPQERLQEVGRWGKVIQCWNLNRIVLFRQPWISQIRSTDKCDARNKRQKRNMAENWCETLSRGETITNAWEENIWCVFVLLLQLQLFRWEFMTACNQLRRIRLCHCYVTENFANFR